MSHRTAAFALAFGVALAATGVAQAQTPAAEPPPIPLPKVLTDMGAGSSVTLHEVAAIGAGVVVGATLWHVVIGHSFALAGAAIGGWLGDWYYGAYMTTPARAGG